jgi:hypothetical protein
VVLLIRGLAWTVILIGVTTCSLTVKLGDRTAVQHVRRIWATPETREMVRGVEEKAGPVLEKVKRGVAAGVREAAEADEAAPGAPDAPTVAPDAGPDGAAPAGSASRVQRDPADRASAHLRDAAPGPRRPRDGLRGE